MTEKIDKHHLQSISEYYSDKVKQFGATSLGVDWNSEASQLLRFEQLSKIISIKNDFSINDLGCGFGSLYNYLSNQYENFRYYGYDISTDMIEKAKLINKHNTEFILSDKPTKTADYTIASGIFNVKLENTIEFWNEYILKTLDTMNESSQKGFSFNCLTSYSDADKMKDYLFYADPCYLFDLCKKKYSKNVTLLHDYGLYEFTILVRLKV